MVFKNLIDIITYLTFAVFFVMEIWLLLCEITHFSVTKFQLQNLNSTCT